MLTSQTRQRLLKQHPDARREFFREEVIVGHRKMLEAKRELLQWIHEPADVEVINVVGPSGIGKSTLMHAVIKSIYEEAMPIMRTDPCFIPTGFITARNPSRGTYDWKEHCIDMLISFKDVLAEQKVSLIPPGSSRDEVVAVLKKRVGNIPAFFRSIENCLQARKPCAVFVDEAQRIAKGLSPIGLVNQADTVRGLAFSSRTLHVLVGTYALLGLRNLNGQLGRRSHTIHFERYNINFIKDAEEFASAFKTFQANLPIKKEPDLKQHIEHCFLRCLGCIGILKSWFTRCLSLAIEDNEDTISSNLFLKAAPEPSNSTQLAAEIQLGEEMLKEKSDEETDEEIRIILSGRELEEGLLNHAPERVQSNSQNHQLAGAKERKKKNDIRPFETKPERYPTGAKQVIGKKNKG